ncbi:hypothetical protein GJ744_004054 [Endocarpon pusillum]|uniref:Starter acyltransferase (SAT) domain-containing protein n=1 Tax=Endocarpon pusillum TaxID=364733 RepID=A0A8H7E086_9EURO|nr:hypothetical protein GJ744_004054 [Endocarpon pusillum]
MNAQQVLLFGDQADAPVPMIRRLVERAHTSVNLQSFLQRSIDSVQLEVSKLLPQERESVGCFRDVQDLVASFSKGLDRFGIVQMVLVFIARIGELILYVFHQPEPKMCLAAERLSRHAEIDPSITTQNGTSRQTLLLGICGGLLPAATAAASTNVAELIQVASFFVGLNCRVAVAISRRSVEIENDKGSWAFSALGSVVTQLPSILDHFHEEEVRLVSGARSACPRTDIVGNYPVYSAASTSIYCSQQPNLGDCFWSTIGAEKASADIQSIGSQRSHSIACFRCSPCWTPGCTRL